MNYNFANSKPFSQVNKPFQFDQTFSIHGNNWNLRCVWFHGKSGFESKVWILDLAIKREIQNGFHPHPPRNLSPNHDFMGVLYTVVVGKAWTKFFFFFCYACACETTVLSKTVHIFSRILDLRTPPPPPCLKKNINSKFKKFKKRKKGKKTNDRLICVEIRFQISCRSIRISKIQVQISQSNTPSLLSSEVSGEFPWQWLLLGLYTLTNFLC